MMDDRQSFKVNMLGEKSDSEDEEEIEDDEEIDEDEAFDEEDERKYGELLGGIGKRTKGHGPHEDDEGQEEGNPPPAAWGSALLSVVGEPGSSADDDEDGATLLDDLFDQLDEGGDDDVSAPPPQVVCSDLPAADHEPVRGLRADDGGGGQRKDSPQGQAHGWLPFLRAVLPRGRVQPPALRY